MQMSVTMSTINLTCSCAIITTLVVISLANLLLLLYAVKLPSTCRTENPQPIKPSHTRNPYFHPRKNDQKRPKTLTFHPAAKNSTFMGALVLTNEENMEFVCGVAVASQFWAVVSIPCWDTIKGYPTTAIKIVLEDVEYGLDRIEDGSSRGIVLIRSISPFKQPMVALASRKYKFVANSSAEMLGWGPQGPEMALEAISVKLSTYQTCEHNYRGSYAAGLLCAEEYEEYKCFTDTGMVLVQRDTLIGVVSFEGFGCGGKPSLFWNVAKMEEWLKSLELSLGVTFTK